MQVDVSFFVFEFSWRGFFFLSKVSVEWVERGKRFLSAESFR